MIGLPAVGARGAEGSLASWLLALMLVLTACSTSSDHERVLPETTTVDGVEIATLPPLPPTLDPARMWSTRTRRTVPVRDPSGDLLLYDPAALLTLRDGRLLLFDPSAPAPLALIDPARGTVARRFGTRGRGPGEIGGRVAMAQDGEGGIALLDGTNRQVHHFTADGEWTGSERFEGESFPLRSQRSIDGEGFLVHLMAGPQGGHWDELVRVDATGAATPFATFPGPPDRAEWGRLQSGRVLWEVVGDALVTMRSDLPSLSVFDRAGTLRRTILLPLNRRNLTQGDVDAQIAHYGDIAGSLRTGAAALTNFLYPVNDSVIGMLTSAAWRAAEDPALPPGVIYWRLFTVRGEYLGMVRQPDDFVFLGPGKGTMWVRILDERLEPMLAELELVPPEDR